MEPWYKIVTPRKEIREGRSFNPDEFAIALEQVVAGTAPEDYRDPVQFFARTCFTRALTDHTAMVLRRLAGESANTSPVLTLITQFGGGKTHTLAALYHLARRGDDALRYAGVETLLRHAGLATVPAAKVAVFVGNAWDPRDGRETPWIDIARQLAGDEGVARLGPLARTSPPGTETLGSVFDAAGRSVLILFDEVLNFLNRHRSFAEPFHAFIQNLTVALTGRTNAVAMISLPRSQVEMTDWDLQWQERITRVVRRVAKDLIANDEAEIAEVVRRRLFEDAGTDRVRRGAARAFAQWCFDRRAELPSEWTAVDTATSEARAREHLESRFASSFPFHPSTLSVFQRKWQALPQYQQTRGTLAMLAQWISWAYRDGFTHARREPLITLGSAPLDVPDFRSVVLGQLGESRLLAAIEADIAGQNSHARALDGDARGTLRDIHRRVATAILFESSGGQVEKVAHLPELRFALGEPDLDTTSIDSAALTLEGKAFFIRKVGSDGFQIRYQPTLKKVVNDRRASLDEETEIEPEIRKIVQKEFERGATLPLVAFPDEASAVADSPRLTVVIADPRWEWDGAGDVAERIREWTTVRGKSPRLYPAALVWCVRKAGRQLHDAVANFLAWKRVHAEVKQGLLGSEFDRSEISEIQAKVSDAESTARDEVWACYRFVVLADHGESNGLRALDLGAGHASASETLEGRILTAMRSEALLAAGVGSGYIDRNWPAAFAESGAWPLSSLRQCFLNGALTRLTDPDTTLRAKIPEFVLGGAFGLASGPAEDGHYERVWFKELVSQDEVTFDADVLLLRGKVAERIKAEGEHPVEVPLKPPDGTKPLEPGPLPPVVTGTAPKGGVLRLRVLATVPSELWNSLGRKLIPKLRSAGEVTISVDASVAGDADRVQRMAAEVRETMQELGVRGTVELE